MVLRGEIKFDDKPFGIFYAGETIKGKFELRVDEVVTQIKSIRVIIRGFAKCEWTRWTGDKIKHYEDQEIYFESNSILLALGEPVNIPLGTQSYPFSCDLTRTVPSSFEGKYGHIRYQATVLVERPLRPDYTCFAHFSVINQYDLNTIVSSLQSTFEKEKLKFFCCGLCESDAVKIRIFLPRTAFVPGELIPIEIDVKNDSNVRIIMIYLYLIKTIIFHTFRGKPGEKKECFEISKETLNGIPKRSRKQFHTNFIISHVTPSNLGLCKLISMEYEIKANFVAPSLHCDVTIVFPIKIGTSNTNESVPYNTTQAIIAQPMPQPVTQSCPIGFVYPPQAESSFKHFINTSAEPSAPPPPAYEETLYEHKMGMEKR